MLFSEALTQLETGIAMRRAAWDYSEGYLSVMPGMKYVWKIVLMPAPNAGNFIFSIEDFNADDWVEFMPHTGVIQEPTVEINTEAA